MTTAKRLLKKPESFTLIIVLLLFIVIEIQSGQFFSANNITDLLSSYTVPGIMALGSLTVFISGGLDVSFPALCSLGVYITLRLFSGYGGTPLIPFIVAAVICGLLGMFNGVIIARFKFAPLIVTLATESLFWAILHGILLAKEISMLPPCFAGLRESVLWTAVNSENGLRSTLPAVFLIFVGAIILFSFVLRRTIYGRKLFAVGGNSASAENIGINVFWIRVSAYVISGVTAGVALMARTMIIGNLHPNAVYGLEYNVIAMVVLGGCALSGGRGSVFGTVLGVILVQTMNVSLTLMNVPTYWQKFCTGAIMLIGISYSAYQTLRSKRQLSGIMLDTDRDQTAGEEG